MSDSPIPVPITNYTDPSQFLTTISPLRLPAVLRGCPLGPCMSSWTMESLAEKLSGVVRPVHVTTEPDMSFASKNFKYSSMDLGEMVRIAASGEGNEMYYLRAVSEENPRTKPVSLEEDFPTISKDFDLPDLLPQEKMFSSVLRVSSGGVRVWTHYDVMDNIYCQVVGHKQAILWPPSEADKLYLVGDKSRVVDIENPDLKQFPLFQLARQYKAELQPGDILFIPALWFHNMVARDFGVAVNVFWRELDVKLYDPKDPYGNKDHLPAAKAMRMLDNVMKQLHDLPEDYRDFYARKLVVRIQDKCFRKESMNQAVPDLFNTRLN